MHYAWLRKRLSERKLLNVIKKSGIEKGDESTLSPTTFLRILLRGQGNIISSLFWGLKGQKKKG